MGVGLSISTTQVSSTNKKIVFDDTAASNHDEDFEDEQDRDKEVDSDHLEEAKEATGNEGDSVSDDDTIEEVKSSVARDKAMQQLAKERETSKVQKLQTSRKKRNSKITAQVEDEDDFDEEFFAQVDSEMTEQRKLKKRKESVVPTGRHTTFLSTAEEMNDSQPIQTDHNIELVVLGETETNKPIHSALLQSSTDSKAGMEPSEASHLFARSRLAGGKAERRGTKKKKQDNSGWKRSKKMNHLAFGRAKTKRRKGRAAANFVVKS